MQHWKDQAFIKLSLTEIQLIQAKLGISSGDLFERLEQAKRVIQHKTRPTVFDRLGAIGFSGGDIPLDDATLFEYTWSDPDNSGAGHEELTCERAPNEKGLRGGHKYRGVYHPDGVCETIRGDGGPGICKHCGRTLF